MSTALPTSPTCRVASQTAQTCRGRIVLVDDEPGILQTWDVILSQSGYDVQCFPDPVSALQAIDDGCDCVITDYHLPQMTGVELIRAARIRSAAKFILMTANSSDEVAQEALSVGACCIVYKPTSPPAVLDRLASLCV